MICFSDSDYAGDKNDRKSTSGFLFFYLGCLVSWNSSKQDVVALSSTEAEYIAMNSGCKEFMYLKHLIESIFNNSVHGTLFEDNESAIKIAQNPVCGNRTKHIEVRFHYNREVFSKYLKLIYKNTKEMLADAFTKPLSYKDFYNIMRQIMFYP